MTIKTLTSEQISWPEAAACAYLLAPLFLFFLLYINVAIAVPACVLIAWCVWELCRSAARPRIDTMAWSTPALLILAAAWVFLGGSFGVTGLNSDWPKHFAVFNFLADAKHGLYAGPNEIMRYSIGWYLVPSAIAKATATGTYWHAALLGVWSTLGVFIFFRLLVDLVGGGPRALRAPLVFILFSGADIIGTPAEAGGG